MPRGSTGRFKNLFPGFQVLRLPGKGFRVQCLADCYVARRSGWRRTAVELPSIPAVRTWIAEHNRHTTLPQAKAASSQMSAQHQGDS